MNYILLHGTRKVNGSTLTPGQQLRVDLYNCKIEDVKELKGLNFKEVTEGHTNGEYTRMYIEVVAAKKAAPKTLKTLIKRVKEDLIENGNTIEDCEENTIIELCSQDALDMIAEYAEGLAVSNKEYNIMTCELYGSHSYCSSKEDLKFNLLCDVIDLTLVGKETTFVKYKKSLMEE